MTTRISERAALGPSAPGPALFLFWLVAASSMLACATSDIAGERETSRAELVSDGRYAMGTVLDLTIATPDSVGGLQWIGDAFAQVAELERRFSRYDPESDLSRFNRAAGEGMQEVNAELAQLLALSQRYGSLTHDSFDVTLAPLVDLWRQAAERQLAPSSAELSRVRGLIGAAGLRLDGERALLASPGMAIDLGGIAKGYALDRLAVTLADSGFGDALLSFGQSSVRAIGAPPGDSGWRLLLRTPGGGFSGIVTLRDRSFSVSSSLAQWTRIDGKRFGHVIDPRSGQPVSRGVQAAVIASTAAFAEALSTALVVLGEIEGVALIESLPDTEAMIVDESGVVASSSGWQRASLFEVLEVLEPLERLERLERLEVR